MAARAISSGTITFGLVSVPVKLYSGTQSKSLHFNMLHAADKSRLRQQYVCGKCAQVVGRDETVRGYEYAKDQYAVLEPEELKALEQTSDQSIEIEEFVPIARVDPIYFDKTYLLGPDKGGHKAYRLLREAMHVSGKAALAKYSTRGKQQLVLVRETPSGLMLHTLFYADEVRSFDDVDAGDAPEPKEKEVELAVQLVEQLASDDFAPERYHDEYRTRALELIEQKIAGKAIAVAPAAAPKGQVIDLMEALKASLAAREGSEPAKRKPTRAKSKAVKPARSRATKA